MIISADFFCHKKSADFLSVRKSFGGTQALVGFLHNFKIINHILQYLGELKQLEGLHISEICVCSNTISFSNESWDRQNNILEKSVTVLG